MKSELKRTLWIGVSLVAISVACALPSGKSNDLGGRNSKIIGITVDSPEPSPDSTRLRRTGTLPEPNGRFVTFFLDKTIGWAGKGLHVWKTENFGESWSLIHVFSNDPVERGREIDGIVFRNQRQGWATLGNSIYSTSDGGATWVEDSELGLAFAGTIGPMALAGRSKAVLLGTGESLDLPKPVERPIFAYGKSIFRLGDNSKAWVRTDLSKNGIGAITRISVVNGTYALAIGEEPNDIFFTSDEGRTWKRSRLRSNCSDRETFPTQDHKPVTIGSYADGSVWIGYDDGRLLKSDDFGMTVCLLLKPEEVWENDQGLAYFDQMCFVSGNVGVARKGNGQMFRTENAGKIWSKIESGLRFDDLSRIDGACFAVADGIYEISTPH